MNTIEILRWIFSYILAPTAVVGIVAILVFSISRIVTRGFRQNQREGAQRVSAAILPFAFLLYTIVREQAPDASIWLDLSHLIKSLAPWQLFLGSVGTGVAVAAQMFHPQTDHRFLMRALVLSQSAVACFIGYVFLGIASGPGMDVAIGVLTGFCAYSVFPNRDHSPPGTLNE